MLFREEIGWAEKPGRMALCRQFACYGKKLEPLPLIRIQTDQGYLQDCDPEELTLIQFRKGSCPTMIAVAIIQGT